MMASEVRVERIEETDRESITIMQILFNNQIDIFLKQFQIVTEGL
jgi:hypothetical protein